MASSAPSISIRINVCGSADMTRVLAPTSRYSRSALLRGLMSFSLLCHRVRRRQQSELLREERAGRRQLGDELIERRELAAQAILVGFEMRVELFLVIRQAVDALLDAIRAHVDEAVGIEIAARERLQLHAEAVLRREDLA